MSRICESVLLLHCFVKVVKAHCSGGTPVFSVRILKRESLNGESGSLDGGTCGLHSLLETPLPLVYRRPHELNRFSPGAAWSQGSFLLSLSSTPKIHPGMWLCERHVVDSTLMNILIR